MLKASIIHHLYYMLKASIIHHLYYMLKASITYGCVTRREKVNLLKKG